MNGVKKMVTQFSGANIGQKENGHEKNYNKNLYENPLWIQGWSGDLNSWAWTRWSELHRRNQGTWSEGYKKWNEEKIKLFEDENNKDG